MAKQLKIVATIGKDGKVVLEGKNFAGKACDKAMADFEEALGKVEDRKEKPEYNQIVNEEYNYKKGSN